LSIAYKTTKKGHLKCNKMWESSGAGHLSREHHVHQSAP
jgi:hypothetical protein